MDKISPERARPFLSVVIPVFNEEATVEKFYARLLPVLQEVGRPYEIVFIDDGSRDGTLKALHHLRQQDMRIAILSLSRNFGKEIALSAGLEHACGEAVVVIDVDLQDPPELIHEFIRHWEEGYDVVYGQRMERDGETMLKKVTAYLFYRVLRKISRVDIPKDTGDFRLMSRRAVDALNQCTERHRFMKGLFAWIGFPQKAVLYRRERRAAGSTKFNYWALWNFALDGITAFTTAPLKIASYLGFFTALAAFLYLLSALGRMLLFGQSAGFYPSLVAVGLCLGGVQLMTIGILGEYVGRMFDEIKGRPLYLLKEMHPPHRASKASRFAPEPRNLISQPENPHGKEIGNVRAARYRVAS